MTDNKIFIPINRKLYDDLVRFSDGRVDPAEMAETQLENWIVRDLEIGDGTLWGDRFEDVAEEYAPHVLSRVDEEALRAAEKQSEERKPLVWREVTIRAGSEVRMAYGDTHHYAQVKRGCIVDDGKEYSPSEWASKVAGNTSRNAWRDLWFREPLSKIFVPAQLLRDQARAELAKKTGSAAGGSELDGDSDE